MALRFLNLLQIIIYQKFNFGLISSVTIRSLSQKNFSSYRWNKNLLPEIIGKVIISLMKKSLILLFSLVVACSFSSCIQSVPSLSSSSDETVMLHWLDMDQEGLVRKTMDDGNATKRDSLFSGKAIETFEQSPTKSVSSWKKGKRHGITTEYFYNGRKRRIISYENGERN